jgi:hypothetical protein
MSQTQHTPGPWEFRIEPGDTIGQTWAPDGYVVTNLNRPREEYNANKRLLAAAPDLLAACQEFVRKVESGEARSRRSYKQMKAAIAKATEVQP